jgi:hypothetical protein
MQKAKTAPYQSDLYARQIADQQLEFLPFTIATWDIADWFVPGGSYNITDKTPMDNLMDIASAAGGFVYSDPAKAEITFKPRWPAAAWEVNKASASVTIPDSVIAEISGQKRVNKRCTSVFVWADHEAGGKGADVYRTGTDRTDRASTQVHALYTDLPVHRRLVLRHCLTRAYTRQKQSNYRGAQTIQYPRHSGRHMAV